MFCKKNRYKREHRIIYGDVALLHIFKKGFPYGYHKTDPAFTIPGWRS